MIEPTSPRAPTNPSRIGCLTIVENSTVHDECRRGFRSGRAGAAYGPPVLQASPMETFRRAFVLAILLLGLARPAPVRAGGDWNDAGVAWQPYEQGLAAAKAAK